MIAGLDIAPLLELALADTPATPDQLRARLMANKAVTLILQEELERLKVALAEHPGRKVH